MVTVAGQVSNSITVPYDPKFSFKDYISLAGGYKSDADRSAVYAVYLMAPLRKNESILIYLLQHNAWINNYSA